MRIVGLIEREQRDVVDPKAMCFCISNTYSFARLTKLERKSPISPFQNA
jgi:hypothetical protein